MQRDVEELIARPESDDYDEEDQAPDTTETQQRIVTIHKSVTHIGVINGPVVIGPQINTYQGPPPMMTPQPSMEEEQDLDDEEIDPIESHFQECLSDSRCIETSEVQKVADNIKDSQLELLCHKLGIDGEKLKNWQLMESDKYSPAYRMLFYWIQRNDLDATLDRLAMILKDCGESKALMALSPKSSN